MFGRNKKVKYFAYGSNISLDRMRDRLGWLGHISPGIPHILEHWKLVFDAGYSYSQYTFANIEYEPGAETHGLIYEITQRQLSQLQYFEALYDKRWFKLPDGTQIFTFVSPPQYRTDKTKKPRLEYLNIIIDGAVEAKLNVLRDQLIKYKNENYVLKKGNKHKKR